MLGKMMLYKMRKDDARPAGGGNQNSPGDLVPAIITAVWPDEFAGENGGRVPGYNITVFPDGRETLWRTSVKIGDEEGELRPMPEE
jgi:hypothetical protein